MPDWAAAGLLEGLEGRALQERVELLDWLHERGFGTTDLRRSADDGLLVFLAAERVVMGGPPTLSLRDMEQRTGLALDVLVALRRVQGLPVPDPDEVCFAEGEVPESAPFEGLGLDTDQLLAVTRVLGRGLAQAAQVMRSTALQLVLEPGATERELAERYEQAVTVVMPMVGPLLERMLRSHLRNMVSSEAIEAHEREAGTMPGARDVAIGFADLVGFTRMGEEVPAERVGAVAGRLEEIASEVVDGPVRLVKTIGDAAMLVSDDPTALIDTGLALVAAVDAEGEGFPQVRVGVARGAASQRGGDWFGRPVNLASRITAVARAGSVLVAEEAREKDAPLAWSFAGERKLKGVADPVKLFRARRPDG